MELLVKRLPDEQRSWQGGDNCNICIGQGDLLVTLMQMVDAYCAIANRGTVWRPHVMKSVKARTGDGSVIQYKPKADSTVGVLRLLLRRGQAVA